MERAFKEKSGGEAVTSPARTHSASISLDQGLPSVIDQSPLMTAQRKSLHGMFGPGFQLKVADMASGERPIQRMTITTAQMSELSQDFNTDDLNACKQEIDTLAGANKKDSLKILAGLLKSKTGSNEKTLHGYVQTKLELWSKSEESGSMGWLEKQKIQWSLRNQPAVIPSVAVGLNMWVAGDPKRGLNWNMLGQHLRGRLSAQQYIDIGVLVALNRKIDTDDKPTLTLLAKAELDACCDDIRGALDQLDNFVGKSYRISGVAGNDVYQSKIKEGDLVKDTTFWSTSAIRGAEGAGAGWGNTGTADKPKVYLIIESRTGKYIAKYSKVEGEQEVLFTDNTVFQVTRIVDQSSTNTFFVYISEIAAAPPNVQVKNYYNGTVYA